MAVLPISAALPLLLFFFGSRGVLFPPSPLSLKYASPISPRKVAFIVVLSGLASERAGSNFLGYVPRGSTLGSTRLLYESRFICFCRPVSVFDASRASFLPAPTSADFFCSFLLFVFALPALRRKSAEPPCALNRYVMMFMASHQ